MARRDAAGQIRQQRERGAAEFVQRHAATEQGMLLEREHRPCVADAGAGSVARGRLNRVDGIRAVSNQPPDGAGSLQRP